MAPPPPPPRSKSSSDIYFQLERTNSEQDLIELLNNCEAPVGDLNQYKIMLSECQKLEEHIKSLKSKPKPKKKPIAVIKPQSDHTKEVAEEAKSVGGRKNIMLNFDQIDKQMLLYEKEQERKNVKQSNAVVFHRRSNSLPSYIAIPVIKIEDVDGQPLSDDNNFMQ